MQIAIGYGFLKGGRTMTIKGTQCELCSSRVQFGGKWHCTVATCNQCFTCNNCDSYWYNGQESCATCVRVQDCPYQSESFPLAYGN